MLWKLVTFARCKPNYEYDTYFKKKIGGKIWSLWTPPGCLGWNLFSIPYYPLNLNRFLTNKGGRRRSLSLSPWFFKSIYLGLGFLKNENWRFLLEHFNIRIFNVNPSNMVVFGNTNKGGRKELYPVSNTTQQENTRRCKW
jgi:hypothetical protein